MRLTSSQRKTTAVWSKRTAVLLCLGINVIALYVRFTTDVHQIYIVLAFFMSFVPYLVHIHYIVPRVLIDEED